MKTLVGLMIFTVVMTSCMNHYHCPTYDGAKGRSTSMVSSKKSKTAKIRTPYYKMAKQAEKD